MADVMHARIPAGPAEQTEIVRKVLQGSEPLCSPQGFGLAWKALFPRKAAEELAIRTGQTVRAAAYQLSGETDVSTKSLTALILEVQRKR